MYKASNEKDQTENWNIFTSKDLARPQHRTIIVFVTSTLIGNGPNFWYISNMTIYSRKSTFKAWRLIFSPYYKKAFGSSKWCFKMYFQKPRLIGKYHFPWICLNNNYGTSYILEISPYKIVLNNQMPFQNHKYLF